MGLSGNLNLMHLAEILQWCKNGRKTGLLTVTHRSDAKTIYVKDGEIVYAGSNDPQEFIGQFLLARGKLTEGQLSQIFDVQRDTGELLGEVSVRLGLITGDELNEALQAKIMETVFNLFLWEQGVFHFQDGAASLKDARTQFPMDVEHCIMEGTRRVDEWARYRELFSDPGMILTLARRAPPEGNENTLRRKILGLLDQGKTIEEMQLELRLSPFALYAELFELHEQGFVAITGKVKEKPARPAPAGFRTEEEEIAFLYSKALPPERVPEIVTSLEDLRDTELTSREAFVLSRINGIWDVRSVAMLCPFREVDALRILACLCAQSIVALR